MASAIHATKHQKLPLQLEHNQQDPNKFYYHFLYKASLVLIFFVILPLFPSQAPEFITQSLLTRNWELLHLLFVGVAISYGLFSRRNDETEKENANNSKFDTAQSLVSRFLHVSSFFEDEADNTVETDEPKVQTWSSKHLRNQPVVVVAPQLKNQSSFDDQSGDKPLLLPIRSLKSRLSDQPQDVNVQSLNSSFSSKRFSSNSNRKAEVEAHDVDVDVGSLNRSTSSKRFSSNSNRNAEVEGSRVENKKKENVVLPSPIPWRSRSGRMEAKQEEKADDASNAKMLPSKEESRPVKPQPQTSRASSKAGSLSPSPVPSFSSESVAKNAEDVVRKKGFYKSCPPPPPPPPPMMFQKSVSMKPRLGVSFSEEPSLDKELKRSFTSERNKAAEKRLEFDEEKQSMQRTWFRSNKFIGHACDSAEKESFLMESDDDDEEEDTESEDEDFGGGGGMVVQNDESGKGPPHVGGESSKTEGGGSGTSGDEGPDVDKKADEFIAKFREQIRLQRIESIKRSTRNARKSSR